MEKDKKVVYENYSVTLDEKVVERARKIYKIYGGKLAPLVNELLTNWVEKEERNLGGKK